MPISSSTDLTNTYTRIEYQQGPAKVTEHHYTLPKGQNSNLVGTFSYRQPSAKAGRLKAQLAVQKRKLKDLESREKATQTLQPKKKSVLRGRIKYLESELCREVASQPVTRVVVHEKGDD